MTVLSIRNTLCTLAVTTLCAAPAFAQDMGDPGMTRRPADKPGAAPSPTGEPVQKAEDYEGNYRGKDDSQTEVHAETRRGAQSAAEPKPQSERPGAEQRGQDGRSARAVTSMRSASIRLSALDGTQIEGLQRELKDQGFYDGAIDGKAGPKTRGALRRYFEAQAQLAAAGKLFPNGASVFGLQPEEIERVKGEAEPQRESAAGRRKKSSGEAKGARMQERDTRMKDTRRNQPPTDAKGGPRGGRPGDATEKIPHSGGSPHDETRLH